MTKSTLASLRRCFVACLCAELAVLGSLWAALASSLLRRDSTQLNSTPGQSQDTPQCPSSDFPNFEPAQLFRNFSAFSRASAEASWHHVWANLAAKFSKKSTLGADWLQSQKAPAETTLLRPSEQAEGWLLLQRVGEAAARADRRAEVRDVVAITPSFSSLGI